MPCGYGGRRTRRSGGPFDWLRLLRAVDLGVVKFAEKGLWISPIFKRRPARTQTQLFGVLAVSLNDSV